MSELQKTSQEQYCPFEDLNPLEYYGLVTGGINFNQLSDLSGLLEGLELPGRAVIAAVGSDGKLERHTQSRTELVVIQADSSLRCEEYLKEFFQPTRYGELFDVDDNGRIDTKSFNEAVQFSYARGDRNSIYPDRVLNSVPVYPTTEEALTLHTEARKKVLEEMSSDKRTRDEMKTQLRTYKRSMNTGEFRRVPTFDEAESLQYYSELWPDYAVGFKSSFLRAVQRKLDLLTLQLDGQKSWQDVARTMPTTTNGRLNYLAEAGIVAPDVTATTKEAYAWFLQRYHHIQEAYKQTGAPVALPFDPEAFAAYRQSIDRFVTL